VDDGREEKSLNGFGSRDQAGPPFRIAFLALRGADRTRSEVLPDLAIVRTRWRFRSFSFPHFDKRGSRFTKTNPCRFAPTGVNMCMSRRTVTPVALQGPCASMDALMRNRSRLSRGVRLVFAGNLMFPKNVFDPMANRVLSHEGELSLRMLTPNCNFQF
jgi:hypothetical protein